MSTSNGRESNESNGNGCTCFYKRSKTIEGPVPTEYGWHCPTRLVSSSDSHISIHIRWTSPVTVSHNRDGSKRAPRTATTRPFQNTHALSNRSIWSEVSYCEDSFTLSLVLIHSWAVTTTRAALSMDAQWNRMETVGLLFGQGADIHTWTQRKARTTRRMMKRSQTSQRDEVVVATDHLGGRWGML